jgi:hypothetical protein
MGGVSAAIRKKIAPLTPDREKARLKEKRNIEKSGGVWL